jgi:coenzyme F420-0:L-glutamate ligase / coenzyme F420-1:gamma-L-glutamate ligase
MSDDEHGSPNAAAVPARCEIVALPTAHRFLPGDDLLAALLGALTVAGVELEDGDVVCVVSKAVALSEGALIERDPGAAHGTERDEVRALARARAQEIVADGPWVTVTRTHHGFVAANGGIDRSNVPGGAWLDLPADPDGSAAALRTAIAASTGRDVAVLISDTFGRPWRLGQTDVALGAAGLAVLRDERGAVDLEGGRSRSRSARSGTRSPVLRTSCARRRAAPRSCWSGALAALTAAGGSTRRDRCRPGPTARGGPVPPRWAEAVLHGLTARRTVRAFDLERPVPDATDRRGGGGRLHRTRTAPHATVAVPPTHGVRSDPDARCHGGGLARRPPAADGVDEATIAARLARSDALHRGRPSCSPRSSTWRPRTLPRRAPGPRRARPVRPRRAVRRSRRCWSRSPPADSARRGRPRRSFCARHGARRSLGAPRRLGAARDRRGRMAGGAGGAAADADRRRPLEER